MRIFTISLLALLLAGSCKKDDNATITTTDKEKPKLTISSPAENATVPRGGQVFVIGNAADNNNLHEMSISIMNLHTGEEVLSAQPHVHDNTKYDLYEIFTTDTAIALYELTVKVSDHSNNIATEVVRFQSR